MILHVLPGPSAVIGVKLGSDRRMVFITPAGCSFDSPPKIPEGTDLRATSYDVDPGPCEALIAEGLKAGNEGLKSRVELRAGTVKPPAAPRSVTRT